MPALLFIIRDLSILKLTKKELGRQKNHKIRIFLYKFYFLGEGKTLMAVESFSEMNNCRSTQLNWEFSLLIFTISVFL